MIIKKNIVLIEQRLLNKASNPLSANFLLPPLMFDMKAYVPASLKQRLLLAFIFTYINILS